MVKWSCGSALCCNTFENENVTKYRLPRIESIQKVYTKVFRTSKWDWQNGYICSAHWKDGVRLTSSHLPEIIVPPNQLDLIRTKFERAERLFRSLKTTNPKIESQYKNAKLRLTTAISAASQKPPVAPTPRRKLVRQPLGPTKQISSGSSSQQDCRRCLDYSNENNSLIEQLKQARAKISQLEEEVAKKDKLLKEERTKNLKQLALIYDLRTNQINYETLSLIQPNEKAIEYLCGIDIEKFDLIFNCIQPYTHLIPYPDNRKVTKFSLETQLLVTLTICRHGIDQKLMAFMLNSSPTTVSRIFNGLVGQFYCS